MSVIDNAERAGALVEKFGVLVAYFWQYEMDEMSQLEQCAHRTFNEVLMMLSQMPESVVMSRDLKKRGCFVGPTTAYSFIQSMGMMNDLLEGCE